MQVLLLFKSTISICFISCLTFTTCFCMVSSSTDWVHQHLSSFKKKKKKNVHLAAHFRIKQWTCRLSDRCNCFGYSWLFLMQIHILILHLKSPFKDQNGRKLFNLWTYLLTLWFLFHTLTLQHCLFLWDCLHNGGNTLINFVNRPLCQITIP